ncbi:Actin cytoskeleton-regulatory complex protein pan1, putative isoform 1 [Cucumis melo var. makuwa]|uniref:Uncharacterized protein LOC103501800 isoform X1 n=2 Tax=Cucumis melo TaxID=3656 RepID=A0A1S3CJX1_CUCME|nr:uncharacterized protein LOC103501800 isoform X1 [Cucumis melo]TYK27929.1 Actin cytoskeleton-regulatory complex protein pan1, putative isoform 1 [Cucumis melo var. makuwa]
MIGMAEEEQKQRCYNNRFGSFGTIGGISGRSSSKKLKPKPKKVPQRGLGVAQLEKIRLEEQQKNDAAAAIFSSSSPLSPTKSSSYLSLPIPSFLQSNRSSSSSSFPSPPPVNISSSASMFGPPLPVLNMPVKDSFTVPLVDQANSGGSETGLSAVTILEQGNALKWQNSCEYYLEKENYGVDPGLAFRSNFDFPYGVNPGLPSTKLLQRAQENQTPSPMVNLSSTTSMSSGLNVQIEPPSNQSYCYGNYSTIWPDKEEKLQMFGTKRLNCFSPNNPTEPVFDHNSSFAVPNRSDDSTSHGNGSALSFREDRARSLTCVSAPSSLENIKDDEFNGNFLTLSSLATCRTSCPSSNIAKCPPTYPLLQNLRDSNSEPYPSQGGLKPVGLAEKQPFYSFLPPAETKSGTETAISKTKCNGEVGEILDLDLKL